MAKEKNVNPVTAHNRAQKARQIKKNRATVAQQRNEKFAKRNPDRLQKQIEALELADANGELRASEKRRLEDMRKDLGRVKKARERMGVEDEGDRVRDDRRDGVLGKRRRDDNRLDKEEESSETDEDARTIPMPTDIENMPPVPRRKQRGSKAQSQPIAEPQVPSQKTYEAKPQIRNLIQESTSRFVPSSVASRAKNPSSHTSRLMEPEELDRLERKAEAKFEAKKAADEAEKEVEFKLMALEEEMGEAPNDEEEQKRAEKVLRAVEVEEVEDEDL